MKPAAFSVVFLGITFKDMNVTSQICVKGVPSPSPEVALEAPADLLAGLVLCGQVQLTLLRT